LCNQFGSARKRYRFADTQQQTQTEQGDKTSRKAGRQRCQRPDQEASGQNPVRAKSIYNATDDKLHDHLSVKKSRKQKAERRGGKLQFGLDVRRGEGQIAAINIIDHDREAEKNQRWREGWLPRTFGVRRRSWGHWRGLSVLGKSVARTICSERKY
jgi:hypothetical protein